MLGLLGAAGLQCIRLLAVTVAWPLGQLAMAEAGGRWQQVLAGGEWVGHQLQACSRMRVVPTMACVMTAWEGWYLRTRELM